MVIQDLVRQYGYGAVLVGTLLEGETIVIAGGFAAHRGYLRLPLVIALALAGSFVTDQVLFHVGRRYGRRILERRETWRARIVRVHRLFEKRPDAFMFGFRFLYGLRTVSPLLLGTSSVSSTRFFGLNLAGAVVWSISFATGGFLFGASLEAVMGRIERYEHLLLIAIAGAGLLVWVGYHVRLRARRNRPGH